MTKWLLISFSMLIFSSTALSAQTSSTSSSSSSSGSSKHGSTPPKQTVPDTYYNDANWPNVQKRTYQDNRKEFTRKKVKSYKTGNPNAVKSPTKSSSSSSTDNK